MSTTGKTLRFVECGSCGQFHRADYWGDCRNDDERFDSIDEVEEYAMRETGDLADIVYLDEQEEND